MNIQLRDSKSLQDAIKADANRKQVAKAQLHPMLLNGIVECDREGFDIRSEFLVGEHRGDPNPHDVLNLRHFLSEPAECEARWKNVTLKQGDSMVNIPQELVFTFADQSKIVIHTQAVSDVTKLTSALPSDQSAKFKATPSAGRVSFTRVGAAATAPVPASIIGELQTQAAILGVAWDKTASAETMVERINAAREAKGKKSAKGSKEELQNA